MSQTFFWDLNHPDDLYLDLVALFFYLHIDLLVLVRNLMHAKFARCNNPLEFSHIRTGHPPEIIIHKNDCRHEFSPVGIPLYPGCTGYLLFYGHMYQPCAGDHFCGI